LPEQATLLYLIGGTYWSVGDYFNTLEYELKALKLSQDIGDKLGVGKALNIIGLVHQSIGTLPKPNLFFTEFPDLRGNSNSSEVCFDLGDYDQALAYGPQSLQIHEDINYQSDIGVVLVVVGRIYLALEEYPRASDYLQRALEISRETDNL
jgi:tetratricopeptide (TPR) repeat protein